MRTKEKILQNQKHGFNSGQKEAALNAMQQYADEFACGFAEWIANNQFSYYNEKWTSTKIYYGGCIYTTKELLEIYKKEINGKI